MTLTLGTRAVPILRHVMRKTFVLLGLLVLALPVAGLAAVELGEGTLSVEDGRGTVTVQARGGVIGRLERGTLTVFDRTPDDGNDPVVTGDDRPIRFVGENGIRYAGSGIRFRIIGGGFRFVVTGRGIDLSVVGKGQAVLDGDGSARPGVYSLDGSDCRLDPGSCDPLPDVARRFQLGGNDRPDKSPRVGG
jgi:hypothetical protein